MARPVLRINDGDPLQNPHHRGDVLDLQERLCRAGHLVYIDGVFGEETDAAIREFQRKHGLREDGMVGPKTWKKLIETAGSEASTPRPRSVSVKTGDFPVLRRDDGWDHTTPHLNRQIRRLQGLLNEHGADLLVDGFLGRLTTAALVRFQREHGLKADGIVDATTWAALQEAPRAGAGPTRSKRP